MRASPVSAPQTAAADDILGYAAPAALNNALWAAARGYAFVVYGDVAVQPVQYDARYGKVHLVRQLLAREGLDWVLWIDADAVVVHHAWDAVALGASHPRAHLLACAEANLETNTRINSGTLLARASPWARAFFDAWWAHPEAALGAPDQWTFDALWRDDALGCAREHRVAVLPATAFNSEPPFYETFRGGHAQPVIHLMGDGAPVRRRVFGRLAAALCAARGAPGNATSPVPGTAADWPPSPRALLADMSAGYAAAAEDAALLPVARVHALDRLGMIYHQQGRHAERAELVRRALTIKEGIYGPDDPAVAHEVQVLANILSSLDRHEEALPLMLRALALNEAATDPTGKKQPHLVAAAHGDLGCAPQRRRRVRMHCAAAATEHCARGVQRCTAASATGPTR
jgi:hypothetical protein